MDGTYGFISVVPVIVLIVVTLLTKRTFESLLLATVLAMIIGYRGEWFTAFINQLQAVTAGNIWVLLVVGLLGGLVGVFERSRAAMGFTGWLSRFAVYPKRSMIASGCLSVILFVDDYLNILTTGSPSPSGFPPTRSTGPMTSSAPPPPPVVSSLSSWSIYYASLINNTGVVPEGAAPWACYMQSIPFMFYPMICLVVLLLVIGGVLPLFGPLRTMQKQADEGGSLYPREETLEEAAEDQEELERLEDTAKKPSKAGVLDFLLPLFVLVAATIYFDIDVLTGVVIALVFTGAMYLIRKRMTLVDYVDSMWEGFSSMVSVLALLVIAFMFKAACENLGMSDYIIGKVAPLMSGSVLPTVIFLAATLMTFALANAWSVSSIMIPLVVSLALSMNANIVVAIAAIFSGSVFGTQLCFYSDNAILISKATGIQPMDHVKTQLPFAMVSGVLTCVAYLIYGFVFL